MFRFLLTSTLFFLLFFNSFAQEGSKSDKKYMVTITYTKKITDKHIIHAERKKFHELMKAKVIEDGYVINDHSKGWIVLHAKDIEDVTKLLSDLPLYQYMNVEIKELLQLKDHMF